MFKSIRWKFITIYFVLVFIAMLISGIFIIREIDQLHVSDANKELSGIRDVLMPDLQKIHDLSQEREEIVNIIERYKLVSFDIDEIVRVIDNNRFEIIATTGVGIEEKLNKTDEVNLTLKALSTNQVQEVIVKNEKENRIIIQIYPIINSGENTGVLFITRDLSNVDETVNRMKTIIIKMIIISSLLTVILGFIISKSISDPIKALTKKAVLMSKGDFDHYVIVKSNDEIGELSETFNFLTKRLKRSLREISLEKTKVEAIVNHMTDGVIAIDNRHSIIHMNPKAMELMHLDSDAYFETDFDNIVKPISNELRYDYITENVEGWVGSNLITIKESIIKFSYAPYMNDQNEKAGIVYVLQDYTEAEKLDAMRRDFVANVSHELKTPLTSIKSYTETLMDGYVDDVETQKQFLKVIDSEADRMNRLVKDLLQLSSFDSETMIFHKEYSDCKDLVSKCIQKLYVHADKKNIKIEFDSSGDQIVGYFDIYRLEQVYINILSNAIKYTQEDGLVKVKVYKEINNIIVEIEDDGIGIPKEDLNNIFDRFYRVDKARTRNMGGTGLGLSIAKEIIKGHDGNIEIDSDYNKGTRVTISFLSE